MRSGDSGSVACPTGGPMGCSSWSEGAATAATGAAWAAAVVTLAAGTMATFPTACAWLVGVAATAGVARPVTNARAPTAATALTPNRAEELGLSPGEDGGEGG